MGAVCVTTHLDSTVSTSGSSMASDLMGLMSKPYTSSQTDVQDNRETGKSESAGTQGKGEDCKEARRNRVKLWSTPSDRFGDAGDVA